MNRFFTSTKNVVVTLAATLILGSVAQGQIAMTRSIFNGAYTPIVGGTTSTAVGDDSFQQNIPVGFTFNYLGTPYTQFSLSTNGWLSFANAATFDAYSPDLYSTTTQAVVAPWWDDLSSSAIVYQTTGTPGSMVCTVQWTSLSYYITSTRTINYQVKLYEATGVIEFWYGATPTGTVYTGESASIGLKSVAGGNGQYLDAVTGSAFTGNSSLQSDRWPSYNFRFTPGAPTVLPGGTYNVGIGQTYRNLNEAAADVNHRGISGPVTFNLVDAQYDASVANGGNFFPILIGPIAGSSAVNTTTFSKIGIAAIISYGGASGTNGAIANQASTTALASNVDPIVGLVGADYVTLSNLDIRGNVGNQSADHGVGLYNSSVTDGATNNVITGVSVTMVRTNTGSRGFVTNVITTPSSALGANSNNIFRNFTITNVYAGIQMTGNATFPDVNNMITNSVCTSFNTIGNPSTANDIGNGGTQTYGIRMTNQSGFTVSNNSIRNVTGSAVQTDGIFIETFRGTCTVANNKVQTVRNSSTSSTTGISGIRMTHSTTGTHNIRVFNNTISEITSAYTGAATAARTLKGIFLSGAAGASTQSYDIYDNTVSIDGSASPNLSNTGFETNTAAGPIINLGNNVFANLTATQAGIARHFNIVSTSATAIGNTGSVSNNNDLFVLNDVGTTGFPVMGAATTYNTVALWTAASTLDAASISANPTFVGAPSNLHAGNLALNGTGMVPPVYITVDQDCASRTPDNDMGAYVIAACAGMPTAGTITGATSVCSGSGTTLTLTGASSEAGITYQWASATTNGGPYTTLLGTSNTQATGPLTVTTYYVVGVGCTISGLGTVTTQFTVAVNPLPTVVVSPTTATYCTGGPAVALTGSGTASTYSWGPAAGLSATTGANVNASPAANTTYTVTGTDGLGCTATATTTISVSSYPALLTLTATPPAVCSGGNSQLLANAATTSSYTVTSIPYAVVPTPGVGVTTLANAGVATTTLSSGTLDDGGWMNQTIPFSFSYFGTNYTSFAISTNGFMWLGTGAPTTYTGYSNAFPSTFAARPAIGAMYSDLDFRTVGTINYFVTGTAPYRAVVVNWSGGNFYNAVGSLTTQLIIYETTNIIEVHTTSSTGTNTAVEGIQNAAGTTAYNVVGRNNVTWAVGVPDGYRWTPNGGTITYSWTPPTFLSATNIANPMATGVTATTTYTVSASNLGCATTGTVTLVAGAALTASGTASPGTSVCTGTNVTLNSTPVGGGAPYTYAWTGPNSFTSTVQNPALGVVSSANAGTYTLVITDNCTASFTVNVTLIVNPLPAIAVSPTSGLICSGGPGVVVTASGAPATYTWGPAAGLSSTSGATVTATPTVTTTYTATATDGNGCASTATTVITVGTNPVVTAVSTPTAVCTGGNATLNASGGVPVTYCQPVYSTGSVFGDYVGNVTLNTLSNPTGASATPYYTLYPATAPTTTTLTAGSTYTVTLVAGTYTQNDLAAWIDFNQNGILNDPTEKLGETDDLGAGPASTSFVFTVPLTANNGTTRFRVRDVDHFGTNDMDPCAAQSQYGETEDYIITIVGGVDPLAYTWSPATFLSSTTGSSVNAIGATATTTYTVTGTTVVGCTGTSTVTLTVNPLPAVALSGNNTICAGDSTLLTGTSGGTSQWYLNGVAIPGATSNTYYADMAGVYNMINTNVNGCADSSATGITVVVNAAPTVTASASPSSVCTGGMVTPNGGGAVSYTWSGGITNNVPFSATATTTYTVTGTAANGCTNTATVTVTVNPLPTVVANSSVPAVCAGSPVTLTGSGATSYTWTGGVTNGVPFTPASTNTYTVTGTDANGCQNTATITIVRNPLPPVGANSTGTFICLGDTITLTGQGALTYSWNFSVVNGVAFVPSGTTNYIVTGTDANGCTNTDNIVIIVNSLPNVTASASDDSICMGSSVTVNGGGASTYTWTGGATDNVAFTPTSTDTYTVTGTDGNGCTDTSSVMITIVAGPVVTLSLPLDTICTNFGVVTLSGETPAGGAWSGPGVTGNTIDPVVAGVGNHAIMYMYMDSVTGCSSTAIDSVVVDVCNGIDQNSTVAVVIYPNPNNGDFTIIPAGSGVVDVMIYSATGQLVHAQKATAGQITAISLDVSGMYSIVIVTADGSRTTQRVIVNR